MVIRNYIDSLRKTGSRLQRTCVPPAPAPDSLLFALAEEQVGQKKKKKKLHWNILLLNFMSCNFIGFLISLLVVFLLFLLLVGSKGGSFCEVSGEELWVTWFYSAMSTQKPQHEIKLLASTQHVCFQVTNFKPWKIVLKTTGLIEKKKIRYKSLKIYATL